MVDSLAITGIISGITALFIAILTHVKHSKCFGVDLTTTQSTTPILKSFPELINNETEEHATITESRPPTPNILIQPSKQTISSPIPIPTTPLLSRANFL